jgi:hypothetical protein
MSDATAVNLLKRVPLCRKVLALQLEMGALALNVAVDQKKVAEIRRRRSKRLRTQTARALLRHPVTQLAAQYH